jgi:hypothetical protein
MELQEALHNRYLKQECVKQEISYVNFAHGMRWSGQHLWLMAVEAALSTGIGTTLLLFLACAALKYRAWRASLTVTSAASPTSPSIYPTEPARSGPAATRYSITTHIVPKRAHLLCLARRTVHMPNCRKTAGNLLSPHKLALAPPKAELHCSQRK